MKKPNFFTMIIAMLVCMGLASSTFANDKNLIVNGDFSNGNTGFYTDYTFVDTGGSLVHEGTYTVAPDPKPFHSAFKGSPYVGENFLIVNGATSREICGEPANVECHEKWVVWQQEVPVEAGVDYEFSFMLTSLVSVAPSALELIIEINNEEFIKIMPAAGVVNDWVKRTWSSTDKSETAIITIYESSRVEGGNDFGIDDIQFYPIEPTPAPCPTFEEIATVDVTDITCTGDEDGKIVLTLNGVKPFNACIMYGCDMIATEVDYTPLKTSTYTYDGLIAGMYTISVMDGNGCMYSVCVEVGDPGPIEATVDFDPILCFGEKTDITITGTGGNPPYTLYDENGDAVWTFMETYTLIDYPAAVYNWTLADAKECTPADIDFEITQPAALTADFTFTPILCNGDNSTVTVTATGGPENGLYELFDGQTSKGTFASEIDVFVTAGTYSWTVVDENNCSFKIQVVVGQPDKLEASYTASEILCHGGTSDVVVTVKGGEAPYDLITDEVTPSMLKSEFTRTVLAGTYNWTVEDANGCTVDLVVTIAEPTALSATYSFDPSVDEDCVDPEMFPYASTDFDDPIVRLTFMDKIVDDEDQTIGYVFRARNGTSEPITNVALKVAGTTYWTIDEIPAHTQIFLMLDSPVAGLKIWWNEGETSSTASTNEHQVKTVCDGSEGFIACFGDEIEVSVVADGGTSPYQLFDGEDFVADFTGDEISRMVGAGVYNWFVVDDNGCKTPVNFTLTQPDPLSYTEILTDATCFGFADGMAEITVLGGTAPFTSDMGTFDGNVLTITGLAMDSYVVVIKDANDCFIPVKFDIGQPAQLIVQVDEIEVPLCAIDNFPNGGPATASATVSFSGVEDGVTPEFTVMDGDNIISVSNTAQLSGLMPGSYSVILTVGNCSSAPVDFVVPAFPQPIVATDAVTDVSCNGGFDGSALITISGGTGDYTLAWEDNEVTIDGDSYTITGLSAGSHNVTIIDANGCLEEIIVIVDEPAALAVTPNVGDILCNGDLTTIELNITGGTYPYVLTDDDNDEVNIVIGAEGDYMVGDIFKADTYNWTLTDKNGCFVLLVIEVEEPKLLTAVESFEPIACFGDKTSVSVTANGGVGEYKLYNLEVDDDNWLADFTADVTITELSEGTYNWIVVDENGCEVEVDFTITQPEAPLTAQVTPGTIACTDGETTALVTAAGGTAPYYLYDGATLVAKFTDSYLVEELKAGTHNWTVTDENSCDPVALSITLINPDPIVVKEESKTDILCYNSNTGVIEVSATGGTGALMYAIKGMPAQDNGLFTELYAGEYTIEVTDVNGCSKSIVVELVQPDELHVELTIENVTCDGENDGIISGMISGGVGPYNVCLFTECLFDDTDQGVPTKSQGMMYWGLEPGNYMVVVRDQNGCMWMECVTVGVNEVELAYDVVEACEVEEKLVSFIYPGLENVDDNASLASVNNYEHNTGLSSISILGGLGTVKAYSDFGAQETGIIVHRGTRGIGIASSPDNDEISQKEGMSVEFTEPVALSAFEVRSLFVEGSELVAEQGSVVLYLDNAVVANIELVADQTEGGVGQFITYLNTPAMVDKIDFFIDDEYQSFSEFALAKLLLVDVKQLVDIALTPSYPGATSFTYLWSNYETTASLTGVEAGDYTVIVTALDEFGAALCFEEFMIDAAVVCSDLTMPSLPVVNNLVSINDGDGEMLSDEMHKVTESSLRAYPNPFTTDATIEFMVTQSSEVSVEVFNLIGERVALVFEGHVNAFDTQKVSFRAESLPNGIYIYKLTAGDRVFNDRIILTR